MLNVRFNRKKIQPWHIFLLVCLIVLVLVVLGFVKEIINSHKISQKINDYNKQINQLERENSELDYLVNTWENSSQLEKVARLKLGLEKPGEKAVLIVRQTSTNGQEIGSDVYIKPNQEIVGKVIMSDNFNNQTTANPIKWWRYFFN